MKLNCSQYVRICNVIFFFFFGVISQKLDFEALEKTTDYDGGYSKHSQIIK